MKKSIYSIPKLCKSKQGWYVHFRYAGIQKRYKMKLNYIDDLQEREREFNMLAKALHQKLKNGWNPLVPEIEDEHEEMTFSQALDFALSKKRGNISPKTLSGYRGSVKFYKMAIDSLDFSYLRIKETKRAHIREMANEAKKIRSWSNKAYNKHLNHIKALLSELMQWDIIETNPAHNIKSLSTSESRANIPATMEEHKIIKNHLQNHFPNFYRFVLMIFHTGIRPKEILSIKLNMIDLEKQQIILPAKITKTNRERIVPINNHLKSTIDEMEIDSYPNDFYLFGSFRDPGRGNVGRFEDFIPGPTPIKRDTATKRWKNIIKDELNIDVNLYSMKHLGANAKIMAGIDLDTLRELYGHTSKLMTMRYAKAVKKVYRQQIIDKSPKF